MIDVTGLLARNGLTASVGPGQAAPLCGAPLEGLTYWKVDILESGEAVFTFPVGIVREGPAVAPTVSEALGFLCADLKALLDAPEDGDWLALHGRPEDDSEWLEAKRDIESTSREFVERLPAGFVDGIVPGLTQSRAEVSASLV